MKTSFLPLVIFLSAIGHIAQSQVLNCKNGNVEFLSEAPLETIWAKSSLVRGVISKETNEFIFELAVLSFEGFNSQLQQEHFFENYMETDEFPKASFRGKMIEEVDWSSKEIQKVRAKGELNIHGVSDQRILFIEIAPEAEGYRIRSEFSVDVKDHDIYIPRMVDQKIAPVIEIKVNLPIEAE